MTHTTRRRAFLFVVVFYVASFVDAYTSANMLSPAFITGTVLYVGFVLLDIFAGGWLWKGKKE